jgi:uncharacterized protein (UPF0335 family)
MNDDIVNELVERFLNIENEIKVLQVDRKELLEEYKDRVDVKAFKAALQIARIRQRLGDSELELDNMLDRVSHRITV